MNSHIRIHKATADRGCLNLIFLEVRTAINQETNMFISVLAIYTLLLVHVLVVEPIAVGDTDFQLSGKYL